MKNLIVLKDYYGRNSVQHENKISLTYLRRGFLEYWNSNSEHPQTLGFIDENLATLHFSLYLIKNHPITEVLKQRIDQLHQSGMIKKLEVEEVFRATEETKNQKRIKTEDKLMLTFDHLGVCFAIFIVMLALSCVVFVIEVVVGRFAS